MARRLIWFALSMLVASVVVFGLLNLLPGNVAGVILGPNATQQAVDALREQLGLDQNIAVRYLHWLGGMLTGDLGSSALTGAPVNPVIADKFAVTLSLVLLGMLAAVLIALPVGIFAALRRSHADGLAVSGLSQVGMAVPVFVVGIALSVLVGAKLQWLPANGYVTMSTSPGQWLTHLILPALTLGLVQSAVLVRYVRSAFIDVIGQDYYRTARAIGWRRWPALLRHGLRNAALQIVTVLGLQLSTLFVGAVVVESVFVLPGLGGYLVQMVANRDLPVVQSIVMILVGLVLVINLLVDLSYTLIDPRLRAGDDEVDD
ncbi:ABC transporter permease [Propionimicrobium sp. PCR01-08-3]|uniref:ABC transporter permease n=1 Tax=Propionimicrobium sp. PCR01-08-3 TaxID=3052086 RepID=UPI00255CE18E|nr:ABC transporter permease [Propionimicrobium sp. PCR01-08-3]WIY84187.1 ABC transporter permease [Propionimicrobium sp. PCR01-08-3]